MAPEILPTLPDDLPELSRFLTEGFHAPPGAGFAAPDVLRWKYFDPRGATGRAGDAPRSFLAREGGRIVGHVGICPGAWHGPALAPEGVSTLHMMDWLSAPGAGVGAALMLRSHRDTLTQFALGGSAEGRRVVGGGGYRLVSAVPVFRRVLRPLHQFRAGRWAGGVRDLARAVTARPRRPRLGVELCLVAAFGDEVGPVLDAYRTRAVFTDRHPGLLNHLLRYPLGGLSGWRIERSGRTVGFGLLGLVRQPGALVGKVVDCVLEDPDPALGQAALDALARELARQGADVAEAFASTDWAARALREAGFAPRYALEFRLRDRRHLIPPGATFHLTPLEADYAYT